MDDKEKRALTPAELREKYPDEIARIKGRAKLAEGMLPFLAKWVKEKEAEAQAQEQQDSKDEPKNP